MFDISRRLPQQQTTCDDELSDSYVNGLMDEFAVSPEAIEWSEANGPLGWAAAMVDFGIDKKGVTPVEMSEELLDEILFKWIPQEVSVQADEAYFIIGEIRAFWGFVARQYDLPIAFRIVRTLDAAAEERLRVKLRHPATKIREEESVR